MYTLISCKLGDLVQLTRSDVEMFNHVPWMTSVLCPAQTTPVFIVLPDDLKSLPFNHFKDSSLMNNKGCDVSGFHSARVEFLVLCEYWTLLVIDPERISLDWLRDELQRYWNKVTMVVKICQFFLLFSTITEF